MSGSLRRRSALVMGWMGLFAIRCAYAATDPFVTPWTPRFRRTRLSSLDATVLDHDGRRHVLARLCNRPMLLTFVYTRCENASKCSTTVSQLAALQQVLTTAGLDERVRLVALSFEPHFDTPARLHRFASDRGMRLGDTALAAAMEGDGHVRLLDELATPVNFNAGWVNTHGIQAVLLDAAGRPVRRYSTLLWDNDAVLFDLKRLLMESQ